MPDKKLTDAEIVKALECASCIDVVRNDVLDLIDRLQAKCDDLQAENELLNMTLKVTGQIKAEAYKEFAERLKAKLYIDDDNFNPIVTETDIDNILKELVGEEK